MRTARRPATAWTRHRRGAVGVAALIVALGATGVLVAVTSGPESPASVAQLPPALQFPVGTTPAASPVTDPSDSSPSTSPVPARSSARTSASPSYVGVGRPSASRRSPTPPAQSATAPPAPFQASYEAEAARNLMGGQARPMPRDDASDGHVVRFVGNNEANFLRFTGLTVPDSGTYSVRIQYISGDPRQATVLINGRSLGNLTFPASPDWYTVDTLILRLPLNAGANTIEVRNDTDYAPDFDRIDLTR